VPTVGAGGIGILRGNGIQTAIKCGGKCKQNALKAEVIERLNKQLGGFGKKSKVEQRKPGVRTENISKVVLSRRDLYKGLG